MGVACPGRGCQGRLTREYTDKALYEQLKFYETLFDVDRAQLKVPPGHGLGPIESLRSPASSQGR